MNREPIQFYPGEALNHAGKFEAEETDAAIQVEKVARARGFQTIPHHPHHPRQQREVILKERIRRHFPTGRKDAEHDLEAAFWRGVSAHVRDLLVEAGFGNEAFLDIHNQAVVVPNEPNAQALFEFVPLASDHDPVAVPVRFRTGDHRRDNIRRQITDPLEQVPDLLVFGSQLRPIGQVLVLAPAAVAEIDAGRRDPIGRGFYHFLELGAGEPFVHFGDRRLDQVADAGEGDKHDEFIRACDTFAPKGDISDSQCNSIANAGRHCGSLVLARLEPKPIPVALRLVGSTWWRKIGIGLEFSMHSRFSGRKGVSRIRAWIGSSLVILVCAPAMLAGSEETGRPVDGIMDNSFLVEEAYNQERGVVQHIFTADYRLNRTQGPDDEVWALAFTQEWPVPGQTHQLSYTIPYFFSRVSGHGNDGLGDVMLNYRWQAFFDERTLTAFAPRVSLILPTGDEDLGFSEDTAGAQVNLPFSTSLGERWFLHFNAGAMWLPDASSAGGHELLHYHVGASAIFAATAEWHFLVEWLGSWNESRPWPRPRRHDFSTVVSPGLRKAFNFRNGSQLVLGLAAPIGLNRHAPEYGAFGYISFEHFLSRAARE